MSTPFFKSRYDRNPGRPLSPQQAAELDIDRAGRLIDRGDSGGQRTGEFRSDANDEKRRAPGRDAGKIGRHRGLVGRSQPALPAVERGIDNLG